MRTPDPLPPSCARRFHAERLLASGSFGSVWLARQVDLDRPAAIKVLRPEALRRPTSVRRFLAEARITAGLDHPGIVVVYDHGGDTEVPWIAYEYLPGLTLRQRLAGGSLPWRDAVEAMIGVLDGLGAAHQAGVLHRDVKPDNVLCDAEGRPKLTDFGIAYVDEERSFQTVEGSIVGTPAYIAPEVARGGDASTLSDMYACGVMLYELLVGQVPFRGANVALILEAVVHAPPPSVCASRPELPRELELLLQRGLAKDPRERPQDATEFAAELREILATHSLTVKLAPAASGRTETPPPARKRLALHPALAAAGAVLLALDVMLQAWTGVRPPAVKTVTRAGGGEEACPEFAAFDAELDAARAELVTLGREVHEAEAYLLDPRKFDGKEADRHAAPAEPRTAGLADVTARLVNRVSDHGQRRHGAIERACQAEQVTFARAAALAFASWARCAQARRVAANARWCAGHAVLLDDVEKAPGAVAPDSQGLGLLARSDRALRSALSRTAERGRLTTGVMELVDECSEVGRGMFECRWPKDEEARAREDFERALEAARQLPGPLGPDLARAVEGAWADPGLQLSTARAQQAIRGAAEALARLAERDATVAQRARQLGARLARRISR